MTFVLGEFKQLKLIKTLFPILLMSFLLPLVNLLLNGL